MIIQCVYVNFSKCTFAKNMKKKLTHEVHTVYLCFLTRLIVAAV